MNVAKDQSVAWQKLAEVPEEIFWQLQRFLRVNQFSHPTPAQGPVFPERGFGRWDHEKEGAMTDAELKQFIAREVEARMTPLLSAVQQLLDRVEQVADAGRALSSR
jgi:hypothetical protein